MRGQSIAIGTIGTKTNPSRMVSGMDTGYARPGKNFSTKKNKSHLLHSFNKRGVHKLLNHL